MSDDLDALLNAALSQIQPSFDEAKAMERLTEMMGEATELVQGAEGEAWQRVRVALSSVSIALAAVPGGSAPGTPSGKGKAPEEQAGPGTPVPVEALAEQLAGVRVSEPSPAAASAAGTPPVDPEALLNQVMDEFDGNPQFESALESLLGQVVAREVLYEPLVALRDQWQPFQEQHAARYAADDLSRFQQQVVIVEQMITIYEGPSKGEGSGERQRLLDLITDMQEMGELPSELLSELPGADPSVLSGLAPPTGCPTQ